MKLVLPPAVVNLTTMALTHMATTTCMWLGNSARNAQTAYYSVVKTLLGVRVTTAKELCLMELGIPSVVARVRDTQKKFLDKLLKERQIYEDAPFMKVWRLCSTTRTPGLFVFEKCAGRRCPRVYGCRKAKGRYT